MSPTFTLKRTLTALAIAGMFSGHADADQKFSQISSLDCAGATDTQVNGSNVGKIVGQFTDTEGTTHGFVADSAGVAAGICNKLDFPIALVDTVHPVW